MNATGAKPLGAKVASMASCEGSQVAVLVAAGITLVGAALAFGFLLAVAPWGPCSAVLLENDRDAGIPAWNRLP
ncbi:MAG: hypothetical protein ACREMY_02830 [bacterium]